MEKAAKNIVLNPAIGDTAQAVNMSPLAQSSQASSFLLDILRRFSGPNNNKGGSKLHTALSI